MDGARWAAVVLLLAACSGQGIDSATPFPVRSARAAPTGLPSERLGPLTGLGACPSPPSPDPDAQIPAGLLLPPGAVVTRVVETGPLTNAQGYVALTPVQVRLAYTERADVEVLSEEDEGLESELLLAAEGRRLFVKASAVCDQGSVFAAVLAPESAADAVPRPTGTAAG